MILEQKLVDYILKNGKRYEPAMSPVPRRGKVGDCFDTCMMAAIEWRGVLRYVEGAAKNPVTGEWILHSWLTDKAGIFAFDPTWGTARSDGTWGPVNTTYIGIEMPIEKLAAFVKKTEYKSIFANGEKAPELADAALPVPIFSV